MSEPTVRGASRYVKYPKTVIGQRFRRLQVVRRDDQPRSRALTYWVCQCDCGKEKIVADHHLKRGMIRSCGCLRDELVGDRRRIHGKSESREYACWEGMIRRCTEPRCQSYRLYGGRGITVCDRWKNSFENFYADMGPKPDPKHSIDRIDPNGNYEPLNCRWATVFEQSINKRTSRRIAAFGETKTLTEWALQTKISSATICWRLKNGWTPERALSEPSHRPYSNH